LFKRTFKAFEYRDFRLMWVGACTSSIGTWMQILAQSWLVYQLSGNPVYLGIDQFLGQIPIFLFSLFGGVFADRKSRRGILLASQVVQMSCAFILTALAATGAVKVWHIWCLSFTVGLAQAFGGPAYSALVPSLVEKNNLQNAIALNSIQFNLARVIGPVLGGLALTKLGAAWCFGLNGLSFVAVIITLLAIRVPFVPSKTQESVLESMKEGFSFVLKREGMVSLIALAFFMTMLSFPMISFLPVFAKDVFHGTSNTYMWFLVASGAGSVTGALLVAASRKETSQYQRALLVMLVLGLLIAGFGFSKNIGLSLFLLFAGGAALMIVFALNASIVQAYVGDAMRGRVMSVYNVAFRGGMPMGSLLSGFLIKSSSAPTVMQANGIAVVVLGLLFLVSLRQRVATTAISS
jgi:predicted MFS family arabinose efflux permease